MFITPSLFAQTVLSNKGKDFWMGFPANYCYGGFCSATIELNLTGNVNTTGNITSPGGYSSAFSVTAGTLTNVLIPVGNAISTNQVVENKGFHITSVDTVTVNASSFQAGTSDGAMLLTTPSLGTAYRIMTYWQSGGSFGPSNFFIVASQNATTVTITPIVATLGGNAAGVPFNVTLNQGQSYAVGANADLTGSVVTATAPVAVYGASDCTQAPVGNGYCDALYEQMFSIPQWGTEYVSGHLQTRAGGDFFRILAHTNGTVVQINGTTVATLNAGQVYQTTIGTGNRITGSNPIAVAQFARGRDWDANVNPDADPFMIMLIPTNKYGKNYNFATSSPSVTNTNHLTITTRTGGTAASSVRVNGTFVGAAGWTAIAGGWQYKNYNLPSNGAYNLIGDSLLDATVYGWGQSGTSTSYGYAVGTNRPIVVLPIEFSSLSGKSLYKANELKWSVSEPEKVHYFIVERYSGNNIWTEIERVEKNTYNYTDVNIVGNTNYQYRMVAYDRNGRSMTSNVVEILSYTPTLEVQVYPNPCKDYAVMNIELAKSSTILVQLYDAQGKRLNEYQYAGNAGIQQIDISKNIIDVPAGVYLIKTTVGEKSKETKLVKF